MAEIKAPPIEDKPLHVLRSEVSSLRKLMKMDGFTLWSNVMTEQEHGRIHTLYQPISDANAVYGQEFVKGEMQGIKLAVLMWELMAQAIEAEIERKEASMTEEEKLADEGREE